MMSISPKTINWNPALSEPGIHCGVEYGIQYLVSGIHSVKSGVHGANEVCFCHFQSPNRALTVVGQFHGVNGIPGFRSWLILKTVHECSVTALINSILLLSLLRAYFGVYCCICYHDGEALPSSRTSKLLLHLSSAVIDRDLFNMISVDDPSLESIATNTALQDADLVKGCLHLSRLWCLDDPKCSFRLAYEHYQLLTGLLEAFSIVKVRQWHS